MRLLSTCYHVMDQSIQELNTKMLYALLCRDIPSVDLFTSIISLDEYNFDVNEKHFPN